MFWRALRLRRLDVHEHRALGRLRRVLEVGDEPASPPVRGVSISANTSASAANVGLLGSRKSSGLKPCAGSSHGFSSCIPKMLMQANGSLRLRHVFTAMAVFSPPGSIRKQ